MTEIESTSSSLFLSGKSVGKIIQTGIPFYNYPYEIPAVFDVIRSALFCRSTAHV
jgi:hypothetical protein